MKTKKCTVCGIEKELSEFYNRKDTKDGLTYRCKQYKKQYDSNHLKQTRKHNKKYYDNNPNIYKNQKLKSAYGISLEEYETLLKKQNGVCAICHQKETKICSQNNKPYMLSVDHNHKTDKVRGLLCTSCNNGLGRFKDNMEFLYSAIKYLKGI